MKSQIFLLAFGLGIVSSVEQYDYRNHMKLEDVLSQECTAPGKMCKSCSQIVLCTQQEDTFVETLIETCDKASYCVDAECTKSKPNPQCDGSSDVPFPCNDIGMFPDPFDCRKFHICTRSTRDSKTFVDSIELCDGDWMYDPVSTYCKTPLVGECTNYSVPLCQKSGDVGALENKSIYYTCVIMKNPSNKEVLYPQLRTCMNGKEFNNFVCA